MTMMSSASDERVAFAIETLLRVDGGWRGLVRAMVMRWPEVPPLELGFSLVSAASAIETAFAPGSPTREASGQGYRLAALVSMDVYAMQLLKMRCNRAADLLDYWKIDPFFERL